MLLPSLQRLDVYVHTVLLPSTCLLRLQRPLSMLFVSNAQENVGTVLTETVFVPPSKRHKVQPLLT